MWSVKKIDKNEITIEKFIQFYIFFSLIYKQKLTSMLGHHTVFFYECTNKKNLPFQNTHIQKEK